MIGLDTNVMVRYIMQDDVKQAAKATKLVESLSASAGCAQTVTFDKTAAKSAGMTLIK